MRPIAILAPMDSEYKIIASSITETAKRRIGPYEFLCGKISGAPVVAAKCFIGTVNSSVAAALAITEFSPRCVIVEGTSGGHDPLLHSGDIVLGENLVDISAHFSKRRRAGVDYKDWDFTGVEISEGGSVKREVFLHSDERLLSLAESVPNVGGKVVRGTVGSSDIWNKELEYIDFCHKKFGTSCEEMEGFAVAQVCRHFSVPCLVIRIVSNSEWHEGEEFNEIYAQACQNFTLEVVKKIYEKSL